MEFITIVHPSQKNSPRLRRQAHSHAARTAHARTRRARAAKHAQEQSIDAISSGVGPLDPAHHIVQAIGLSATVPVSIPNDFQHEPLASFRRSLTPKEHMLFDLYTSTVAPDTRRNCPILSNVKCGYGQDVCDNWTILSTTDIELLRGSLLTSCRWLSIIQKQTEYAEQADRYKLQLFRDLQRAIADSSLESRREAVSKALVLTFDEISMRNMPMAQMHLSGALHIVNVAGGMEALGLSDLISFLLSSCVFGKKILDSVQAAIFRCNMQYMCTMGF